MKHLSNLRDILLIFLYNSTLIKIRNNGSNTQQALWVALGSIASFGVTMVTSMILSRYFDKNDYGTYKQVMYVYHTLLTVFTLGLPQAFGYYLPRVKREQGRDVVGKITSVFFLLGAAFSGLLYVSASFISSIMNNDALSDAIRIFSPVPFLLLPTMGLESIYSTYRKTYISSIYVVLSRCFVVLCVVFPIVLFGGNYKTALAGFVIASLLNFIVALYLKNLPFRRLNHEKSDVSYKTLLKFSLPLMYGGIWGMVINSADQFFISRYFGTDVFAEFSNGSMELPFVGMIVGACTTVLYPLFSRMNSENLNPQTSIFPVWKSVFQKTAMVIYPLVVFCWVYARELMVVLYGAPYEISAGYFRIKLVANLFTLIAFAPVVLSIGKTKYYANVHMYSAIGVVLLEWICVNTIPNPYLISIISVVCHIARIFAMLFLISSYFSVPLWGLFPKKLMIKILLPSALMLFVIKLLTVHMSPLLSLVVGLLAYLILYLVYSFFAKLDYISLLKPILKK